MAKQDRPLGELEMMLLFALLRLGDGAYGVPIRREIAHRTGRDVSAGAIYTTLRRLESRGLVSSRWGEPTAERGGKRKRFFAPTAAGAAALDSTFGDLARMAEGTAGRLATLAGGEGGDG